jgi:hypothetical protein
VSTQQEEVTGHPSAVPINAVLREYQVAKSRTLDGQICKFVVDTGAMVTLVHWWCTKLVDKAIMKHCDLNIRGVSGELAPVDGTASVKIDMNDFRVQLDAYVAEKSEDCILGTDFL